MGATPPSTSTDRTLPNNTNPPKQASASVSDTTTCVTDASTSPPTESVFIFSPRVQQPISFLLAATQPGSNCSWLPRKTHTHRKEETQSASRAANRGGDARHVSPLAPMGSLELLTTGVPGSGHGPTSLMSRVTTGSRSPITSWPGPKPTVKMAAVTFLPPHSGEADVRDSGAAILALVMSFAAPTVCCLPQQQVSSPAHTSTHPITKLQHRCCVHDDRKTRQTRLEKSRLLKKKCVDELSRKNKRGFCRKQFDTLGL